MVKTDSKAILFFDGYCHLCNGFTGFLNCLLIKKSTLFFSPIQGEYAKIIFLNNGLNIDYFDKASPNTIILFDGRVFLTKSSAVIKALMLTNPIFIILIPLYLIPKKLRDLIYDLICAYRFSWFGRSNTCIIPQNKKHIGHFIP